MLSWWWHEVFLMSTVRAFSSCPQGEIEQPPTHTLAQGISSIYRAQGEACSTRSPVRFHKSISLSVSCQYLPCVTDSRKQYPQLIWWLPRLRVTVRRVLLHRLETWEGDDLSVYCTKKLKVLDTTACISHHWLLILTSSIVILYISIYS